MKDFFGSSIMNTGFLLILGAVAIFTKEIVTFLMLGFVIIVLSTLYDKLDEISKKLDQ